MKKVGAKEYLYRKLFRFSGEFEVGADVVVAVAGDGSGVGVAVGAASVGTVVVEAATEPGSVAMVACGGRGLGGQSVCVILPQENSRTKQIARMIKDVRSMSQRC